MIGEEEISFEGDLGIDYTKFKKDLIPENTFKTQYDWIDFSDSIVWIDPLDGTKSFVDGYLDGVTTLIGVSIK